MRSAPPVFHLFGFISMTPVLWTFFVAQTALVLVSLRLCLVPIGNARRGRRLIIANTLAVPFTFAISALSYVAGMVESFAEIDHLPPSEKAAVLANSISTTMNVMWLWLPFAVIHGVLLAVQVARYREAVQSRAESG